MGLAERNLKRDEEAEETLVHAISVFKGSRIKACLQKLYAEADGVVDSGKSPFPLCPTAPRFFCLRGGLSPVACPPAGPPPPPCLTYPPTVSNPIASSSDLSGA